MKRFIYKTRIKPHKIVLQYFGNDIEFVAAEYYGKPSLFEIPKNINKYFMFVISVSYFFNYLYWSFPHKEFLIPYLISICNAYKNKDIFERHKKQLKLFVDYAKENSIQFIVVIFPFLGDLEMSDVVYGNNVANYFKANNVSIINVSQLVKNVPLEERMVSKRDIHASIKVNKIVAEEILKKLK